ncbi:uncharacterized protein CDAR_87121 [Caerostris darwini]|uniref:Uncharacterized protein n=2 Tax=Caerostris TaxID=172845 RepID=A0AAV4U812_9ARAC|nr:uncharacterized protein CDAR_87121 [Caerostris darwini]GIY54552.1 uncharacterized protein CEXT_302311 [Caerostris extrusa]
MSLALKVSGFAVLLAWLIILLSSAPGYIDAGPNSNISVCHFCDDNVDFSVRNLLCCSLTSRCCGPDRI